jgi:hypothetical protein
MIGSLALSRAARNAHGGLVEASGIRADAKTADAPGGAWRGAAGRSKALTF